MRTRPLLWLLACLAFCLVGCERAMTDAMTAEIDEPAYRRGKELLRQGRDQEALAAFLRVIEQRGDEAPESHLEVGLLYQRQVRDPIAAIFHYRKFVEAKPHSPQADLVRQRIAAAMREFADTLPMRPLENQEKRNDLFEQLERLQRENLELKDQLALTRANAALAASGSRPAVGDLSVGMSAPPSAAAAPVSQPMGSFSPTIDTSPPSLITRAPLPAPAQEPVRGLQPPTRPADAANVLPSGVRRHTVARGDTLYNLAQRYYNDRARWRDIYAANRSRMSSENDLRIGMELVIP
jgi:tetratricopeptide (TPR) repeat protein